MSLIELIVDEENKDAIFEYSPDIKAKGNIFPIPDCKSQGWDHNSMTTGKKLSPEKDFVL